ncbi:MULTISPECIES: sensor histidine kinase [Methylotenera]|uniref:sensor histidine kinase n=1 Tax=Methylotenera TaxID=359407 RepID=UPI000370C308|nr:MULTISPECIES: sensor histidine kinase [Methylotenera]
MISLNKRLSYGLTFSLIVLLGLQWGVISYVFSTLSEKQLINRLDQDSESLLSGISFDAQGQLLLNPQRVSAVYQRPLSGHYYVINVANQHQYSRSLWDNNLAIPIIKTGLVTTLRTKGPEGQILLMSVQLYKKHQQIITIAVAEDLTEVNQALRQFQWIYGGISLLILLALLLIQRRIVSNSLKPLQVIRDNLLRIESGEVSQIESLGPAEISPVIAEFNRLLKMMGNQSRRSREALGNLAHALKTQLTILNQTAEQFSVAENKQFSATIYETTDIMRHIVERELKRARLIGNTLPGRRVDVQEEVTLMVKTLQLMHVAKTPIITYQIDNNISYIGDQEDFSELLGNLLDNACKWCNQQVHLTIKTEPFESGQGMIFMVEDDGVGCELDKLDALTQRGFRLDETKPGSGLGLAIVHDIVESYNGKLTFDQSVKYGGLRVCVWLPN